MNPADDQPVLDPQVTAKIKELVDKDVSSLTDDDKIFLRARKDYLGRQARRKLGSALDENADQVKQEEANVQDKQNEQHEQADSDEE